jgi:hypothetical protein
MNIIHDFNDNDSLDFCMTRMAAHKEDIIMHTHGHTTVWGTPIGIGRVRDTKSLYQQLRDWWADHQAARRETHLARLKARWDARREAVRLIHADAAVDMVAPTHAFSTTTTLCDLTI